MIENISFIRKKNKFQLFLRMKETLTCRINSGKREDNTPTSIRIFYLFLH